MVSNYEISRALEKVLQNVKTLEAKVDLLPGVLGKQFLQDITSFTLTLKPVTPSGGVVLLSVAEGRTLEVMKSLGTRSVTADEVSVLTKRARAVESMHLNVLHRRGLVLKERKKRKALFTLKEEYRSEGQAMVS
jgi:hypothetical protein